MFIVNVRGYRRGRREQNSVANSYFEYSHLYIDLVDRGGLFKVKDEVFNFFLELELCAYILLCQQH